MPPLPPPEATFECTVRSKPQVLLGLAPKQEQKIPVGLNQTLLFSASSIIGLFYKLR